MRFSVKKRRRIMMKRHLVRSATLALLVLTALCLTGEIARCAEVILEENITYGKAGDTELKLDLARPAGRWAVSGHRVHPRRWLVSGQSTGISGTNPRGSETRLRGGDHQLPADAV